MKDKSEFISSLDEFFSSENSVVLITGIDDDEKIKIVLSELNKRYTRGTIYVNALNNTATLLNRAFGYKSKAFPRNITRTKVYSLGNMRLSFEKYSEELMGFSLSENDDFAVYYPVQVALMEEKSFKKLIDHIKVTKALKTIIVTTNDLHIDTSKLNAFVDQHIHYEIKNDNEELYGIVKRNVKNGRFNLELNSLYNEFIEGN